MITNSSLARTILRGSLIMLGAWMLAACLASAQTVSPETKPYASMNRNAVYYAGAGSAAADDLRGNHVTIGMTVPLEGPLAAEGKALLQAAQMALDEESKTPLPGGRHLVLAVRDESGQWGQASDEIVRLIFQDEAVAIITSPAGTIAHEAEQVANKIGVPVVTLSTDATTTQINMPWIFRLAPSDEDEASAFAQHIYRTRGLRKVVLLAQPDHDGRAGAEEFERAVEKLGGVPPIRVDVPSSPDAVESVVSRMKTLAPDAVVLWTDYDLAANLVPRVRQALPVVPVYLCRKAAESAAVIPVAASASASQQPEEKDAEIWISASPAGTTHVQRQFHKSSLAQTGAEPTEAAAAAYDAVHIVAAAVRRAGANRVRVRDALAAGNPIQGASGAISFDSAGNEHGHVAVVRLGDGFK